MPGTPPNSPRFNIPRPSDGDVASFSAQVNAITDGFDAAVAKRVTPDVIVANATVADHQIVVAPPNVTVSLPVPTSEHEMICVYANESVTGSTPITVNIGAGTGKIFGRGLAGAGVNSFQLGMPGAFVWLFSYDGVNWRIVQGEVDSGWVPMTLGTGMIAFGYTPASRLKGDHVMLKGGIENNSGQTVVGIGIATIASGMRPSVGSLYFNAIGVGSLRVEFDGSVAPDTLSNGNNVQLDGIFYTLS